MANMPAFQASDASSILAARTKISRCLLASIYFDLAENRTRIVNVLAHLMRVRAAKGNKRKQRSYFLL
jgi:hypothetical protein